MVSPRTAAPLTLSGSLTTPGAEDIHRQLRTALDASEGLVIDCAGASEVDVSFLQLLAAAQRTAARAGKTISLAAPPQGALAEALARCGFAAPAGATALAEVLSPKARAVA